MSEDLNNEVPENMEGEEIDNIVILKPNQNILIDNIVINTFPSSFK